MSMKIVFVLLVLLVLVGMGYSITGNVVAEDNDASGFFERIWNFLKGFFAGEEDKGVEATAKVSIGISPNEVEGAK